MAETSETLITNSAVGVIAKDAIQVTPIWAPGIPRLMLHGFVKQPLKIRLAGTDRLVGRGGSEAGNLPLVASVGATEASNCEWLARVGRFHRRRKLHLAKYSGVRRRSRQGAAPQRR